MGTHPIFESDFDCLTERKREWLRIRNCTKPLASIQVPMPILSRRLTARWLSSFIQIRTQERKLSVNSKKFLLLMKCSLTTINVRLTIDSDSKDSKKVVVAEEVSVEMISSPCSSVVVPHSVAAAIEVITGPDEVKMLAMNSVLLLRIFIMERQRNWLFKDKLFVKNVQEKAVPVHQ